MDNKNGIVTLNSIEKTLKWMLIISKAIKKQ